MTVSSAPQLEFRDPRRARGIAAVEFVVSVPFIFLLLFGGAELGRVFVHYQTLSYAIRDSARFVSENSIIGTTGVISITGTTVTRAKNLAVYGNIVGSGNARLPNYFPSHVAVVDAGGDNIRVSATYPYQSMLSRLPKLGFFGGGTSFFNFNMHIAVTMRAIS